MIKFFTPFRLVLLAALVATAILGFITVPAGTTLPVHWGIAGEADGFMPRDVALLLPLLVVAAVWAIVLAVTRFSRPESRQAATYVLSAVLTAFTALLLTVAVATVLIGTGAPINMVQVIVAGLAVLLLALGNAMPKSRPNSYAGLRIPTTLRSESNWQATHRLTGRLMMLSALILLVAAFIVPVPFLVYGVLACVIAPLIIGAIYSIALARQAP